MNIQRHGEEARKKLSSRHADRAMNTHEQVWNDNPSIQEAKEATGHSTAHH